MMNIKEMREYLLEELKEEHQGMKRVFFVFRERKEGDTPYDSLCGAFESLEAAQDAAHDEWRHMARRERELDRITVCHADVEDETTEAQALEAALADGYYEDETIEEGADNE